MPTLWDVIKGRTSKRVEPNAVAVSLPKAPVRNRADPNKSLMQEMHETQRFFRDPMIEEAIITINRLKAQNEYMRKVLTEIANSADVSPKLYSYGDSVNLAQNALNKLKLRKV